VDAWVALIGAVAGATIAIVGQYAARRSDARERAITLLLEQCAEVVALAEDYRSRVWEERNNLSNDAVARWNISAYQLAEARLKILCRAPSLVSALDALRKAGIALGKTWRLSRSEGPDVQQAWEAHREALNHFIMTSGAIVRPRTRNG
jgi:hypothetical protein